MDQLQELEYDRVKRETRHTKAQVWYRDEHGTLLTRPVKWGSSDRFYHMAADWQLFFGHDDKPVESCLWAPGVVRSALGITSVE